MANATICDATGEILEGDYDVIAELAERSYGPEAAEAVRKYLKARDDLHNELAEKWAWGILRLREEFRLTYPTGKLPDEF